MILDVSEMRSIQVLQVCLGESPSFVTLKSPSDVTWTRFLGCDACPRLRREVWFLRGRRGSLCHRWSPCVARVVPGDIDFAFLSFSLGFDARYVSNACPFVCCMVTSTLRFKTSSSSCSIVFLLLFILCCSALASGRPILQNGFPQLFCPHLIGLFCCLSGLHPSKRLRTAQKCCG